ncbi:MAG: GNAT family N-acetyltransferase [Prolixibacteraceae bacterium]|nr:GNAT family N-acetyltransferase [Prolixibacteraceae bacterium]
MLAAKVQSEVSAEIPQVSSEIFETEPGAQFWIGKVAVENVINSPEYYVAATKLRANVYIDEMHFLTPDCRDANGCERDQDDDRSVAFATVERSPEDGVTRVIGTSRLIKKRSDDEKLPVEELFPEVFEDGPAEVGALEVSRFISRHEDKATQHLVALALIRSMTQYAVNNENLTAYFVIERPFYRLLQRTGLPMEVLSEPRILPKYGNTKNMAVRITPKDIIEQVDNDIEEKLFITKFFKNENGNLGLGFYPENLTRKKEDGIQ